MPAFILNSFSASLRYLQRAVMASLGFGYTTNLEFLLMIVPVSLVNWFAQYSFFVGHLLL